jgi:hypothetical protein
MKRSAKWALGIVTVLVGLGFLPYAILYVGHIRSETITTKSVRSPDGLYEAYVSYKKVNWTESRLCIRDKNGKTVESFPVTGKFNVEDVEWSQDSNIAAVMFRASSIYGTPRPGLYGVQVIDISGSSCESFGDFDIPVDDKKEMAGIESWEWSQPNTIRFNLYIDSQTRSQQENVLFRIIHTPHDFRMVRSAMQSSGTN